MQSECYSAAGMDELEKRIAAVEADLVTLHLLVRSLAIFTLRKQSHDRCHCHCFYQDVHAMLYGSFGHALCMRGLMC